MIRIVHSPRLIAANTDWSHQTVREHQVALRSHGLVDYHDETGAVYRLTGRGRADLEGELDASDLENGP